MKENTIAISVAIIMTAIVVSLCVVGFYYFEDKKEVREAEIFFNGTMLGQAQLIQQIQTNGVLPYFNETGELNTISFQQLCSNLNQNGGQ